MGGNGGLTTVNTLAAPSGGYGVPGCVGLDSKGNVYVLDQQKSTLIQVTSGGVVSTLAGVAGILGTLPGPLPACLCYPRGLAVDPTSGVIYVTVPDAVLKID